MALPERTRGTLLALGSAALFGASAPLIHSLSDTIPRLTLSALLYLGAGLGLVAVSAVRPRRSGEAPLARADLPRLLAVIATGGVAAPWLLVGGLARASGSIGALALGLELPFTAVLATVFFGDALGRREWLGLLLVMAGGALLGVGSAATGETADALGVLLVGCACALWALDTNITQRLSAKDPVAVSRIKCLAAGAFSLLLSLAILHEPLPSSGWSIAGALLAGFFGYGLSLVLFTLALRAMGAARTGAVFATAPFLGALLAVPVVHQLPSPLAWPSAALMALGLTVMLGVRHSHAHRHAPVEHARPHLPDLHHRHGHEG